MLEDDPSGWNCYADIDIIGDHILPGHCAGDRHTGGLSFTQITRFPIDWLYTPPRDEEPRDSHGEAENAKE